MRRGTQTRILTTVLFTDIVGSTALATELEDRRWRGILAKHNSLVRSQLKRHGGREIDTAGDGFFAIFDRPAEGIRCAAAIIEAVRELGIEVRAGLHMGECEVMGRKVGGIAVHIAARVLGEAGPSEVLVSGTVKDLVAGSGLAFEDRGVHALKGVSGEWRLFALHQPDGARTLVDVRTVEPEEPEPSRRWTRLPVFLVLGGIFLLGVGAVLAARDDAPLRLGANSVVAIDSESGEARGIVEVGAGPASLAVGGGAVWVANLDDGTVSRVDSDTLTEAGSRGGIGIPTSMAVGEGGVWVADGVSNTLYEIDPGTNRVEIHEGVGGNGVAVGFNYLWVIDAESDTVLRIDPTTLEVDRIRLEDGSGPAAIATGQGAVWVANELKESVTRIDPFTREIVASDIALCCPPTGISVGPSGVWITSRAQDAIARIDPQSNSATQSLEVADAPEGIAVAADGVWIANSGAQSIWRLDPVTEDVIQVAVDGSPRGVVVADDGTVWVTVAPRS
jgi:class 3 adenylate cyclase